MKKKMKKNKTHFGLVFFFLNSVFVQHGGLILVLFSHMLYSIFISNGKLKLLIFSILFTMD